MIQKDPRSTTVCKICDKAYFTMRVNCSNCSQYSINLDLETDPITVESELVTIGNYHFCYFPQYQEGHVIEKMESEYKVLNKVSFSELTPELAKYWLKKLKKYLILQ